MGSELDIVQEQVVQVLTPDLRGRVTNLYRRIAASRAGCVPNEPEGKPADASHILPRAEMLRSRVYTGTAETGSYNHHSALAKFRGRYVFAWDNGFVAEDKPGQRTLMAWSDDGRSWSEARCVVPADVEKGEVQHLGGLMTWGERLVMYYVTRYARDTENPLSGVYDEEAAHLNIAVSEDGEAWERHEHIVDGPVWIYEAPRPTQGGMARSSGTLMCPGALNGPVVFRWAEGDPVSAPKIVRLQPVYEGRYIFGEATWYQVEDGRIVVFWRDEAASLCMPVSVSEDDGRTWLGPMLSDFPDAMSRSRAGRLTDGRCYLIGNSYPDLLNRSRLMLSLSDDGHKFDRMYTLVDEPTAQRAEGKLKVHGYQYPTSVEEEDRLIVGYSVNKEDIECGIVQTGGL